MSVRPCARRTNFAFKTEAKKTALADKHNNRPTEPSRTESSGGRGGEKQHKSGDAPVPQEALQIDGQCGKGGERAAEARADYDIDSMGNHRAGEKSGRHAENKRAERVDEKRSKRKLGLGCQRTIQGGVDKGTEMIPHQRSDSSQSGYEEKFDHTRSPRFFRPSMAPSAAATIPHTKLDTK